MLLSEPILF